MNKATKLIIAGAALIAIILLYPRLAPLINQETLRQALAPFGIFAPLAFALIYIIAGLLFLPVSALSIAAGALFGTWWGLIIVLFSATAAAALAFIIGRPCCDLLPRAKRGIVQKLQHLVERRLEKSTFHTVFILRLLYVPYMGLSYAAGLVRACEFWPFVWATFLTNIVGSFVFVYLGSQLGKGLTALIIPAALIALSLLVPYVVKRFVKKGTGHGR